MWFGLGLPTPAERLHPIRRHNEVHPYRSVVESNKAAAVSIDVSKQIAMPYGLLNIDSLPVRLVGK